MALELPENSDVVKDRLKTGISTRLDLSNPFRNKTWLRAFAESVGERLFDFYVGIGRAINEVMLDTTFGLVDRWASFFGLSRLSGGRATGTIIYQAVSDGFEVPVGTIVVDSDGNEYETLALSTSFVNVIVQTTLTQVAGLATWVGGAPHYLNNGDEAFINSADDAEYNGTFVVSVIDDFSFTYEVPVGAPASTTGGVIASRGGSVAVQALEEGADKNLAPFELLTFQSTPLGIDEGTGVDAAGFDGGADLEGKEGLRSRTLERMRNPVTPFNVANITQLAKTVATVTRVFVSSPFEGAVIVTILTDNDSTPTASIETRNAVEALILGIKPAHTSDNDVTIATVSPDPQDFTFTSLTPNTVTMQQSIVENLKQFFASSAEPGTDVDEDAYRAAIFSTVDVVTGQQVTTFELSAPSGDISIGATEIATLGSVVFP